MTARWIVLNYKWLLNNVNDILNRLKIGYMSRFINVPMSLSILRHVKCPLHSRTASVSGQRSGHLRVGPKVENFTFIISTLRSEISRYNLFK